MYFEVTKKEPKVSSLLPFFLSPTFLALVAATAVIILNILLIILFSRRIRNKRNYRYAQIRISYRVSKKMHTENQNKWGQSFPKPGIHNTTNGKKLSKEFWEIRKSGVTFNWSRDCLRTHLFTAPYVCCRDAQTCHFHFLYELSHYSPGHIFCFNQISVVST